MNLKNYKKKLLLWSSTVFLAASSAMAQIPTDGLVAYYPFNGNANDESGNGNNPYTIIGANLVNDRIGNSMSAYSFSGNSQIRVQNSSSFNFTNGFTISLWLNQSKTNCPNGCDLNIANFGSRILDKAPYGVAGGGGFMVDARGNDGRTLRLISNNTTTSVASLSSTSWIKNTWNHLAISYNNNIVKYYLNGQLVNEFPQNITIASNNLDLVLGNVVPLAEAGSGFGFNGVLDEIRFYNRPITDCELVLLYNTSFTGFENTPQIELVENKLIGSITTISGYSIVWRYNGTTLTGYSSNTFTGTLNAGTYTMSYKYLACESTSDPINLASDIINLETGLKAYYPFNGNANDESGNGNSGTITGSVITKNRFFIDNSAYTFNGINNNINIGKNSSLKMTQAISISVWVKPNDLSKIYSNVISDHAPGETSQGSGKVLRFQNNQLQFQAGGIYPLGSGLYARYDFNINEKNWIHIVATYDRQKIKLHINGILVNQVNNNLPISVNNNPLLIGNSGYGNEHFNGNIDNMRIYSRALNQAEVSALYSEGCPGFVAEFSYGSAPYCQLNFAAPQGTVTGGHFVSQTGLEINTVSGLVNLQASQPGVYNVEYHVPAQYGCTSFSGFATLTISGVENQTSTINICANGTKTLTGTNAVSWIELGGLGSISDNLFTSNGTAGFATVVGINADGCTSAPIAFEIAPNPVNTTSADAVPVAGTKILSGTGGNIFVHNSGVGSVAENEFSAGLIPGTAQISYINTITGCSTSFTQLVSNGYEIAPVSVNDCSTLPFVIPIQTPVNIGPGVIGLDIELNYNTSIMTPTGVAYLGSVVTTLGEGVVDTYVDGSILHINISYNGAGELSGSGLIVAPEFTLISGTTAAVYTVGGGNVKESYLLYEADVNLNSELFTVLHYLPTFTGHVFHWGNTANPVINNTNTLSGVLTATALESCASLGKTSGTDATGTFSIEMGERNYGVAISRDIPTDAPVMDVINGFDAVMITRIRNGSLANPTVEQLIAADVNGSGSITSGDRTLLRRRTLMQDTQFPGNVPDWKFYDITTTFSNYNRNSVPAVLTCIPLNSYIEDGCPKMESHSFTGILIGDVDGSYVTDFNEGQNLRTSAEAQVIYDLSAATTDSKGITDLPVRVVYSGTVYSLDAMMEYDDNALSVQSVGLKDEKNSKKSEPVAYNHYKKNLLLATVDNENGFENESYFLSIKVKKLKTALKPADLGTLSAYINGKRVAVTVNEDAANSIQSFNIGSVNIYPNPSETGVFQLEFSYSAKVEYSVFNGYGVEMNQGSLSAVASKAELNLSSLPKGVYFLKLSSGTDVTVKKIVID